MHAYEVIHRTKKIAASYTWFFGPKSYTFKSLNSSPFIKKLLTLDSNRGLRASELRRGNKLLKFLSTNLNQRISYSTLSDASSALKGSAALESKFFQ